MLSYPFHSSDKSAKRASVAFTKFSSSPCAVIFHNRASLYRFGDDFIVCCASLESPVASEVEYSAQVVTHFHNVCGVLIIAFVNFGATTSAHRTMAFPVFCTSGFAYFPPLERPHSATAGNAISQSHRACSCTAWFPQRNFAVHAEISPAFSHTYHIACCTGSKPVAPPNIVLAIGIAPVATQNPACTHHLLAWSNPSATSCPD